jgi:predicted DsbA family dithiol-disulfide isomerase
MRPVLAVVLGYSLCLAVYAQEALSTHNCVNQLSEKKKSELVSYIVKKYRLSPGVKVALVTDKEINRACYRALTFEGKSPVNTWRVTLYLSPDQKFLTDELFDITVDPWEDERRKAELLMEDLVQNKGASTGPKGAVVTIVVFSDFECPYCRNFADILHQVLVEEKDRVRLVFHHLPLSMHPWARSAAEGAACAQLQSAEAFWAVHDYLFAHQDEITADNLKQKVDVLVKDVKGLDFSEFQNCEQNQMSLGLVLRDMNLASSNSVTATPTLFINGHRVQGIKDAAQLRQLIAEAEEEIRPDRAASSSTIAH